MEIDGQILVFYEDDRPVWFYRLRTVHFEERPSAKIVDRPILDFDKNRPVWLGPAEDCPLWRPQGVRLKADDPQRWKQTILKRIKADDPGWKQTILGSKQTIPQKADDLLAKADDLLRKSRRSLGQSRRSWAKADSNWNRKTIQDYFEHISNPMISNKVSVTIFLVNILHFVTIYFWKTYPEIFTKFKFSRVWQRRISWKFILHFLWESIPFSSETGFIRFF